MRPLRTFNVRPALPEPLKPLEALAYNLRWSWDHEAMELVRRIDPDLWESTGHNPVLVLGQVSQERLKELCKDDGYMAQLERVVARHATYRTDKNSWFERDVQTKDMRVAYFSCEFGLTECLEIYSGGLGILAGDHMKSSSNLGIPLVGVGLLYQQGFFRQYLNEDGWQQERYPENDFYTLPIQLERDEEGEPITVSVEYPDGPVMAQIWRVEVGKNPLILLDTNIPQNARSELRDITDQLYGGGKETRIRQEVLLGIGGVRALEALNLRPTVCHINEGHSAFLALERIRLLMHEHQLSYEEAVEAVASSTVFTTHTPVPAGNETFSVDLIDRYLMPMRTALGLSRDEFLKLGEDAGNASEPFSMTVLALNLSSFANGVSRLHGEVSRKMWIPVWPDVPEEEIPIRSITNGTHTRSIISHDLASLFDRYLGPRWRDMPAVESIWERLDEIPSEEIWRTHERRRERLVAFARRRLKEQLLARGAPAYEVEAAEEVLNPEALTIGFARRFATYKRANLLLHDVERLKRILLDEERPVQIIFAGKAHPADNPGKGIIRQIVHFARNEGIRAHVAFLEDYDIALARYLVQGVDVWLNTPRRPMEASGTSGMKATANGALNISILDGWWVEAYEADSQVGWAIGQGEDYSEAEHAHQDAVEAQALYTLLEKDAVPIFYDRGRGRVPREWVQRMKMAMRVCIPLFSSNRMVKEYTTRAYVPAHERGLKMIADSGAEARKLASWRARVETHWSRVAVRAIDAETVQDLNVGKELSVRAAIALGGLQPEDVSAEIYHGRVDARGEIVESQVRGMECVGSVGGDGTYEFVGAIPCTESGRYGFAVRLVPYHRNLPREHYTGFIHWANL